MESNFDKLMTFIQLSVIQVIEKPTNRVDISGHWGEFDKMTVYQCGDRVIRIDLHIRG